VLSYDYEGEGVILNGTGPLTGGGVFNVINSFGFIYQLTP